MSFFRILFAPEAAKDLFTDKMDSSEKDRIISAIKSIDSSERMRVSNLVQRTLNLSPCPIGRDKVIDTVKRIVLPPDKWNELLHYYGCISQGINNGENRGRLLNGVFALTEQKWGLCEKAALFFDEEIKEMDIEDRLLILETLKEIDPDKGQVVFQKANLLAWGLKDFKKRLQVLNAVADLSKNTELGFIFDFVMNSIKDEMEIEERIEFLYTQVLESSHKKLLFERDNRQERIQLMKAICTIPPQDRMEIVSRTSILIHKQMSVEERLNILSVVKEIPFQDRGDVVYLVSQLIHERMDTEKRLNMLSAVKEIPSQDRRDVVSRTSGLIHERMSAEERLNILSAVKEIPFQGRRNAVYHASLLVREEMNAGERIRILSTLSQRPFIRRNQVLMVQAQHLSVDGIIAELRQIEQPLSPGFQVDPSKITEDPNPVLKELLPRLQTGVIPIIKYTGSEGADAGGVSRDFVTRLFAAVCDREKKHLPMEEENGKLIPLIENETQITSYRAIGALMAFALQKTKDILTGSYFSMFFFKMMHSLLREDVEKEVKSYSDIPKGVCEKFFEIYAKERLRLSEDNIHEILRGNVPESVSELTGYESKEEFFTEIFKKMSLACYIISRSLISHLKNPSNWNNLKGENPTILGQKIEGLLSKDQVLRSLRWKREQEKTQGYLTRWIEECSEEELGCFVWAITGSKRLSANGTIEIQLYDDDNPHKKLPIFHTCSFTMDLPDGYPDYDTFEKKLKESLTSVEGFQAL